MSRAFVKESDDALEELPERPVSPHRNLVTPSGLAAIEEALGRAEAEVIRARSADDKASLARALRDARYWSRRRGSAELVPAPIEPRQVRFGVTVELEHVDGRQERLRIVGEDEADPTQGSIAYVAPVAREMLGATVGDTVQTGSGRAEIVGLA
jgi:transcription elongation GreA/GreB family factor